MSVNDARQQATGHLNNVRGGFNLDNELAELRKRLTDGGLTLADIGTSEEELERLRTNRS
jgi:hypothetical protein